MKKNSSVMTIIFLLFLSLIIYWIQLTQFHSPRDTFFYLMQDLAFLPIQVALVTIALGKIIEEREKRERLNRTNMLVSAFFSEIGSDLMKQLISCVNTEEIAPYLNIKEEWSSKNFIKAANELKTIDILVDYKPKYFLELKEVLKEKRKLLMVIISNPVLLEHETFTDMLWAIFHLTDELIARDRVDDLPDTDISHLNNDIKRAFSYILIHWLGYMNHIKTDYPYLFSLEMRRNPLNKETEIIIK